MEEDTSPNLEASSETAPVQAYYIHRQFPLKDVPRLIFMAGVNTQN